MFSRHMIAAIMLILSGCMNASKDKAMDGDAQMEFEVKLSYDSSLTKLHDLHGRYSIQKLSDSYIVGVLKNTGKQNVEFPCSYLQGQGIGTLYYSDDPEEYLNGYMGLADPQLKSNLKILRPGESCIAAVPLEIPTLKKYLAESSDDYANVHIKTQMPMDPVFGEFSGASKTVSFQVVR